MSAQPGFSNDETAETVNIADLVVVQAVRSTVSNQHVQMLAGLTRELPPILVHRSTMQVIDGYHRILATLLNGSTQIQARFFDGSSPEAFIEAVKRNVAHGLPLSLADRKIAATRLLTSHGCHSNRAIGRITGLSEGTIRTLRLSIAPVKTDSRSRRTIAIEGRTRAYKLLQGNPDAPLRTVAKHAGISLGTAHDVRKRLQRGDGPVPTEKRRLKGSAQPSSFPSSESEEINGLKNGNHSKLLSTERKKEKTLSDLRRQPDTPEDGPQALLGALRRDPALRFNEHGRRALHWFLHGAIPPQEWRSFLPHVPAHQVGTIAEIARRSSQSWADFANEVERLERRRD